VKPLTPFERFEIIIINDWLLLSVAVPPFVLDAACIRTLLLLVLLPLRI
jgi:hypothetical protein